MSRIRGTLDIARPVEDVFDFVADQRNEPAYNPRMTASTMLTNDPIGVGTRFAATMLSRGKPLHVMIEVTGFDRPRRVATRSVMAGAVVEGEVRLEPTLEGTRFFWDWTVTLGGPGRFAGPAIALIGRHQEKTIWTGLKHHLEQDVSGEAQGEKRADAQRDEPERHGVDG
ncbi:carbon monoxide dehydrogenase subunit G [Nocardioides ginsengisegetis]|uniref:Carbon monoxide dehydrogenase subunit G n=1 Tax=Nocardioides ginsengisegetis TaxID=661491 RepID=A0A7W3P995_9ACTN|nr:SRPBCC family protein [Nocardioides ginsengisegetis]MBA8803308.1 carbon monoxide dehydrogenase subunit G [Nocardioides ginsengisegetis]